ncbi:MAG: 50S ribosomal protein L35 [Bacteroidota bacterium]
MPKMKTNSSAKKRFQVTGSGKVKRKKAFKRHILTKKSHSRKKELGKDMIVDSANFAHIKKLLVTL